MNIILLINIMENNTSDVVINTDNNISDDTIITIHATNGTIQTYYKTIKEFPGLTNKIVNNMIVVNVKRFYMSKLLNYIRGIYPITELNPYANELKEFIEINDSEFVSINIGGKNFCIRKNFLSKKFGYFDAFFRNYDHLNPDYTSILIDRCSDLFVNVLDVITQKKLTSNKYIDEEINFYCYEKINYHFDLKKFPYLYNNTNIYKQNIIEEKIDDKIELKNYNIKEQPYLIIYLSNQPKKNLSDKLEIIINNVHIDIKYGIIKKCIQINSKVKSILLCLKRLSKLIKIKCDIIDTIDISLNINKKIKKNWSDGYSIISICTLDFFNINFTMRCKKYTENYTINIKDNKIIKISMSDIMSKNKYIIDSINIFFGKKLSGKNNLQIMSNGDIASLLTIQSLANANTYIKNPYNEFGISIHHTMNAELVLNLEEPYSGNIIIEYSYIDLN
ncbi:BTB/POZ domain-containing protein [Megavirus baoshan]|uniref:BTB/POZ domain-containing protein n=1 Tax=Megavirus baoshan TaxID=2496520 RepID=A0A3S8UY74_9VIRU|nr:BTB/POZ domain-containing protein [Megavirus baoshan]AZL89760.1 BTB/POZ domain-containing protein [Megavirus baoshan]